MRVEAAGRAGQHARHDHGQHGVAVGADARGLGQALVLAHGAERAPHARAQESRRDPQRRARQDHHEVVVVALADEREALGAQVEGRHAGQAHGPLRQLHPVGRHEPDHLGEAHRDEHEVGAAELEGEQAEELADERRDEGRRRQRRRAGESPKWSAEQPRRVGADAEEGRVAEVQLSGREEQVHARRRAGRRCPP